MCTVSALAGSDSLEVDSTVNLNEGSYRVELHVIGGIGATRYSEPPSIYGDKQVFIGYNVNFRLMWHPDHLMSIGLMSGYQVFSHESIDSVPSYPDGLSMELNSIPLHLVFEVRPMNIRFGAGIGLYLLQSQLNENGVITHSDDLAYGGSAWIGYTLELADRLRIGPDIVLQVLSDRGVANLSAMITLQYDLLRY